MEKPINSFGLAKNIEASEVRPPKAPYQMTLQEFEDFIAQLQKKHFTAWQERYAQSNKTLEWTENDQRLNAAQIKRGNRYLASLLPEGSEEISLLNNSEDRVTEGVSNDIYAAAYRYQLLEAIEQNIAVPQEVVESSRYYKEFVKALIQRRHDNITEAIEHTFRKELEDYEQKLQALISSIHLAEYLETGRLGNLKDRIRQTFPESQISIEYESPLGIVLSLRQSFVNEKEEIMVTFTLPIVGYEQSGMHLDMRSLARFDGRAHDGKTIPLSAKERVSTAQKPAVLTYDTIAVDHPDFPYYKACEKEYGLEAAELQRWVLLRRGMVAIV